MGIISELWIIDEGGALLYNQRASEIGNDVLLTAFFTAITNFAKELTGGNNLEFFNVGDSSFIILKSIEQPLLFVGRTFGPAKAAKAKKILTKIEEKFVDMFRDEIKSFNGRVDCFDTFKNCIDLDADEDVLVEKFKKLNW